MSFQKAIALILLLAPLGVFASDSSFNFGFAQSEVKIEAGESKNVRLALKLQQDGAYVHPKAPMTVKLSGQGLELSQDTLKQVDAQKRYPEDKAQEIVFEESVKAVKPGMYSLKAELEFFFCTASICEKREAEASLKVEVKP